MNLKIYDNTDFIQNPSKYTLFKTARIAEKLAQFPNLLIGEYVSIRYFDTRINSSCGNVAMPIYDINVKGERGYVYACALSDFCL